MFYCFRLSFICLGAFILFPVFFSCKNKSEAWEVIRKTEAVYPKDSIVSYKHILMSDSETVWINSAYQHYSYKKQCKNLVKASFRMTDQMTRQSLLVDTFRIAKMLLSEFRENGITHFALQSMNEDLIYLYSEDEMNPITTLYDFFIPNTAELRKEPDWKTYTLLLP